MAPLMDNKFIQDQNKADTCVFIDNKDEMIYNVSSLNIKNSDIQWPHCFIPFKKIIFHSNVIDKGFTVTMYKIVSTFSTYHKNAAVVMYANSGTTISCPLDEKKMKFSLHLNCAWRLAVEIGHWPYLQEWFSYLSNAKRNTGFLFNIVQYNIISTIQSTAMAQVKYRLDIEHKMTS